MEPAARIPAAGLRPEDTPNHVVETDHKEVEVAESSGHGGEMLRGVVEYRFRMDLEPAVRIPPAILCPKRAPHRVVKTDNKQVQISRSPGDGGEVLRGVVKNCFRMDLKPAARTPPAILCPKRAPHRVVKTDNKQVQIARGSGDGGEVLRSVVEYRFRMDLKPAAGIPPAILRPERAPHGVVEADYKQVEITRGSGDHRNLLSGVIEDSLRMDLEPAVGIPAAILRPERGPDSVVEANHKQVEVAGGSGDDREPLCGVVENRFGMNLEPATRIPAAVLRPEGGPNRVVEADNEKVEIAGGARDHGDLLAGVIEHDFRMDLEPPQIPAASLCPEGAPNRVVEADNEKVEIALSPRDGGNLLRCVIEHGGAISDQWSGRPSTGRIHSQGC